MLNPIVVKLEYKMARLGQRRDRQVRSRLMFVEHNGRQNRQADHCRHCLYNYCALGIACSNTNWSSASIQQPGAFISAQCATRGNNCNSSCTGQREQWFAGNPYFHLWQTCPYPSQLSNCGLICICAYKFVIILSVHISSSFW